MSRFVSDAVAHNIGLSLAVIALILAARWGAEFLATRRADRIAQRRRAFLIRTLTNTLLAVCLLSLWMSQIQSVMLSLTAVMVSLVVATKELIMCVAGSALRIGGHLFKVGDRIEVNGLHGEVIDHGMFSTTVMELPPVALGSAGTGRTLMLPNSVFLTGPVRVEAQPRQFAPHFFKVTLETCPDVAEAVRHMEEAATKALASDLERATRFHRMIASKYGAEIAGPGCEVSLGTSDLGRIQLHVMLYCLVQDARRLERATLIDFFAVMRETQDAAPAAENDPGHEPGWNAIARKLQGAPARQSAA